MTLSVFLALLASFSTLTALVTEAVKKSLPGQAPCPSNIIALVIALLVGIGGTAIFYLYNELPFDGHNILTMVLMGLANWLGATTGYDKVTQAISQFTGKK